MPLTKNTCTECLDYESVLKDLPKSRMIPSHSGNSNNNRSDGEKVVPLAMAVMLLLCCIMIGLIKQVENDQMEGLAMRELLVQNPSATNCSYGAQVARAQNALMAGLLERRPSVLELASRLVQEDQLYMQARQAIGEQPPSYIDPLGTQSNSNQSQGDAQNTTNITDPQDPLNNWQNYASIHVENNNTNSNNFQNNRQNATQNTLQNAPQNTLQNTPQNTFQNFSTTNHVNPSQRSPSTSSFRNLFTTPKVDSNHSLSRQNSTSSLLPSYSNSMLETYQHFESQKSENQRLENQKPENQRPENQRNHHYQNHNMEASDSNDSTETVIQIEGILPIDRHRSGLSFSSNSFTPSEIIYEESELRIDVNKNGNQNED